ncbi:MAG: hypothetical protein AB1567_11235 [bacterium]
MQHDGKVKSSFIGAYEELHILGYYRGKRDVDGVKIGFKRAKFVIEYLSHRKIS